MFAILTKAEIKKLVNTIHTLTFENKQLKAENKNLKKECDKLYARHADLCLECFKLRYPDVFSGQEKTIPGYFAYEVIRKGSGRPCSKS